MTVWARLNLCAAFTKMTAGRMGQESHSGCAFTNDDSGLLAFVVSVHARLSRMTGGRQKTARNQHTGSIGATAHDRRQRRQTGRGSLPGGAHAASKTHLIRKELAPSSARRCGQHHCSARWGRRPQTENAFPDHPAGIAGGCREPLVASDIQTRRAFTAAPCVSQTGAVS